MTLPIETLEETRARIAEMLAEALQSAYEAGAVEAHQLWQSGALPAKAGRVDEWDRWYAILPDDLRHRLSLHDFKRLGDLFKVSFGIV